MNYEWLYKIKYSNRKLYEQKYQDRIKGESTFKYKFKIKNHLAFVVANLQILQLISDIYTLNNTLLNVQAKLPSVAIDDYKRKCLIEEADQTNKLEGVASTKKEIEDILYKRNTTNNRLSGIVNKYALLLTNSDIKLSTCTDVRTLYNELVLEEIKQNDPENMPDGVLFRKNDVYVKNKSTGEVVHKGVFPESEIINDITELLSIIDEPTYHPLINIAVIHYAFGYIHPFYDGNGRMSRFISSYLISKQLNPIISFRIAYSIKKDTARYYKMFKLTNETVNRGEMTGFVIYFLELICDTLKELIDTFTENQHLLKYYEKKTSKLPYDTTTKNIYFFLVQNKLFSSSGFTVDDLCTISNKCASIVRKSLKNLEKCDLLLIEKGRPFRYTAKLNDTKTADS